MLGTYVGLQIPQPSAGPAASCLATGPTWTAATVPSIPTFSSGGDIASSGAVLVAASAVGNLCVRSTDRGASWASTAMPAGEWKRVAYGNGTFVAVAGNSSTSNLSATSADGVTWTSRNNLPSNAYWYALAFGGGVFLAVAFSGGTGTNRLARSADGVAWTSLTMPVAGDYREIAYGGGKWVAIRPESATPYYSTDNGTSWASSGTLPAGSPVSLRYGGGVFIVTHASNVIDVSADGVTWTSITLPFTGAPNLFAYSGGMWLIQGSGANSDKVALSSDGLTWTQKTIPLSSALIWGGDALRFFGIRPQSTVGIYGECPTDAVPAPAAPAGMVGSMAALAVSVTSSLQGSIGAAPVPAYQVGMRASGGAFGQDVRVARAAAAALLSVLPDPARPIAGASGLPFSVDYETVADGFGVAGVDFTATSGTLTFNSDAAQSIEVPLSVARPAYGRPDVNFLVRLKNPAGWSLMPGGSQLRVIHKNDWPAPGLALAAVSSSGTSVVFEATLEAAFYFDQRVTLTPVMSLTGPPPAPSGLDSLDLSLDGGSTWIVLSDFGGQGVFTLPAGTSSFRFRFVGAIRAAVVDGLPQCDVRIEVRLASIFAKSPVFYVAR